MINGALGLKTGFFSEYRYMDSVVPLARYPAVELECESSDYAERITALAVNDFSDPFWQRHTSHLGRIDAAVAYTMVKLARPEKIIEIGSGRSTQVLARAVVENGSGSITCIDPAPRISIDDLPVEFHRRTLLPSDAEMIADLSPGDILYIDSSHILHPGTDVDMQLNLLFPRLAKGVIVHVHDIFLPYDYPPVWASRGWNEAIGVAAWIAAGGFDVLFPVHYALIQHAATMQNALGDLAEAVPFAGGSFWMRKR